MKIILVIDDNPDIRENTAEILELAGYKTFTAENGKKGVDAALKEKPDVIVCDIMMPDLDGYGVLHMLRKNEATQHTPFIFLTAKTVLLNAIEARLKKSAVLETKYAPSLQGVNQFIRDIRDSGLMSQLADQYEVLTLSKKQHLYQEGKRPRFLYYLVKGKIKGFKVHEDGKEYITDLFSEGDFMGYPALIEDKNYDDSTVVLEEAEVMQIPREDFLQMIYGDISIAAKFIRIITQNVKEKEERLMSLAYSSLRKRVAKALVDIHGKFNSTGENKPIEISRDDIAHYVGTATESLIRTLSDFKGEKLIEIREGKINISNLEKLRNLLY
ncbi:MAG: response regulator [Chitinophagaceae bacterium]|nr:response regulator [Chitinophagaceae bacterium]